MAKKKQPVKRNYTSIIVAVVLVLGSIAIISAPILPNLYTLVSGNLKSWVIKVNGEQASLGEYKYQAATIGSGYDSLFGYEIEDGVTLGDQVVSEAINAIVYNKLCKEEAGRLGLANDEADDTQAQEALDSYNENFTDDTKKYVGLSDDKLKAIFLETLLANKVYDHYTKDYTVNEAEFDQYFIDYVDKNRATLIDAKADFVITDSLENAQTVIDRVNRGEELNFLVPEYSIDASEREIIESVPVTSANFPQEVLDVALKLSEGDITEPIEVAPAENDETGIIKYYVLKLTSVIEPDWESVKAEQRETFINDKKSEMFQAIYEPMHSAANIEYNTVKLSQTTLKGAVTKEMEAQAAASQTTTEAATESTTESGSETEAAN